MSLEDISVSVDVKCEKVTKTFAIELVKSMNIALAKVTTSINSMNSNLSKRLDDMETGMTREISAAAKKAEAALELASQSRAELEEMRIILIKTHI